MLPHLHTNDGSIYTVHSNKCGYPCFDMKLTTLNRCFRILNVQVGETSKVAWLGVEANPLIQSEDHSKFYSRPSEALDTPSSKWFISKNTIISGLGRLGIRKDSKDLNSSTSKARRKRIVRTKVSESSV